MKKKIGLSFIVISVICFLGIQINKKIDIYEHKKMIDNFIFNGGFNNTNYIGYIEIKSLGIKRGIVNGINDDILNNNDVGMIKNQNIILAGHAITNVFGNLSKIKIGEVIEVYLYNGLEKYIVLDKIIVEKDDLNHLDRGDLILITCTNDDKRLLIISKKDI